jgi:acetyltransferase-like isoleucine patch superfamily enzyme
MQDFFSKIRRRKSPFYAFLFKIASTFRYLNMPRILLPFYRGVGLLRHGLIIAIRHLATFLYYEPLFRSQCIDVGKHLNYIKLRQGLPYFHGNIHIFLGDQVTVHSRSSFSAASLFEQPCLNIGDKTYLGPGLSIGVAKEISIGAFCFISSNVTISDNDGHPLDPFKRARGEAVAKNDVLPVKIDNYVWVGEGSTILKGVSIGQGAVIGAKSVVRQDIAPMSIVMGNPAIVVGQISGQADRKNYYHVDKDQDLP